MDLHRGYFSVVFLLIPIGFLLDSSAEVPKWLLLVWVVRCLNSLCVWVVGQVQLPKWPVGKAFKAGAFVAEPSCYARIKRSTYSCNPLKRDD